MTKQENLNQLPATDDTFDYYPSLALLKKAEALFGKSEGQREKSILKGYIARSDGANIDEMLDQLDQNVQNAKTDQERHQMEGLRSRARSVMDLSARLYDEFSQNPNSMANWYKPLKNAVENTNTMFSIPQTKVVRLPIELAQFIRLEYQTTSEADRAWFNDFLFQALDLKDDTTYFIKTGTFSSKFEFHNARCQEPREIGEYFQVIQNFAMLIGAGDCVDLVVREYIEDVENNPTIYGGMPLHTEFRVFVDSDRNEVIGAVPYWNPLVMKRALKMQETPRMAQDYKTYLAHEDVLMARYNQHVTRVENEMKEIVKHLSLAGKWSIDVMLNGDDFYIIDMAKMESSALTELL